MTLLSSMRCPVCRSDAVRPAVPTAFESAAFRCHECGCVWSVLPARSPSETITADSSDITPPPCPRCGAAARAIVEPSTGATRYECTACGTLFTTAGEAPR